MMRQQPTTSHRWWRRVLLPALAACVLLLSTAACGSSRRAARRTAPTEADARLTPEQERRYQYFFLEALRMKEKGDYASAFELYRHCLQIDPEAASALYEMAQFYLALNQPERGLQCMEQACRRAPDNFWYWQALANLHRQNRDIEKTIDTYEAMTLRFPSREDPLMALGSLYDRAKDYDGLIRTLDRLEQIQGKSETLSVHKFRTYMLLGDHRSAFREIEALVGEYPEELRYRTLLGDTYLEYGKPQQAYDIYREVLDEEPTNAAALLSMATYYEQTGQDSLCRQQMDTLLLRGSVDPQARVEIMRQIIDRSEPSAADSVRIVSLFDRVLERNPDDVMFAMFYAQYLLTKKMDAEAVPVLDRILALDPENTAARMQLLVFAIRDNDADEVVRVCRPALEFSPDALEFCYYLSLAYMQQGKVDSLRQTLEVGVTRITEKTDRAMASDLYGFLGDIYHQDKRNDEAFAAYDSALVYKDDNISVLNNYAYFLSLEKRDLDKAEEMSFRTVKAEPENATYLDTYAWVLFVKGRYAEARLYIDSALKHADEVSGEELEHAGDIYYHCGETDKALEYWRKAQEAGVDTDVLKRKIKTRKYCEQ